MVTDVINPIDLSGTVREAKQWVAYLSLSLERSNRRSWTNRWDGVLHYQIGFRFGFNNVLCTASIQRPDPEPVLHLCTWPACLIRNCVNCMRPLGRQTTAAVIQDAAAESMQHRRQTETGADDILSSTSCPPTRWTELSRRAGARAK